jgi:glycosyltransferase involved in cell wall biosynthesis
MNVSLVIPAYNEAARLPAFLQSVVEYAAVHPSALWEVIIVNDGSSDDTAGVAQSFLTLLPQGRLIDLEINQGKGAAVQTGVLAARGDVIIFMDADGATGIGELPRMMAALQDADVAIGNRWIAGATMERHSWVRHLAGWLNRRYMMLFGLGEIDTMCGFKGFKAHVAKKLFSNLMERRWLFDTEVAYKAVRMGYKIVNFPIAWESKDGSKLTASDLLLSALRIWPLIRRIHDSI